MPEFVNPFSGLVPRKLSNGELARAIMLDVAAELEAIHLYQSHIDATDDEYAKAVLAHVRNEEEEHLAQFMALLRHLAPDLAAHMEEGHAEIMEVFKKVRSGVAPEEAALEEAGESAPQAARSADPQSVGDLKG